MRCQSPASRCDLRILWVPEAGRASSPGLLRCPFVFVDEAAQNWEALGSLPGRDRRRVVDRAELVAAVGPSSVVVGLMLGQDEPQVSLAEDEHPVGDLGPGAEHRWCRRPEPFQRFTENTITARHRLDAELDRTRQRGYAIDEEETGTGLSCVAAAIHSTDGRPAAAISVSGLSDRMHSLDLAELGKRVQAHCATIEAALQV